MSFSEAIFHFAETHLKNSSIMGMDGVNVNKPCRHSMTDSCHFKSVWKK